MINLFAFYFRINKGANIFQYQDEIPYSVFVEIYSCKGVDEGLEMAKIEAIIHVSKESQVSIMLGKGGSKIKALGISARKEIESYLGQKVYLGLTVKIKKTGEITRLS